MSLILKNGKIVLEDKIIENGYLVIDNDKIQAIVEGTTKEWGIDLKGQWVLPGFIDMHVHGGYGVDFETGDANRFEYFAKQVGKEGITKYLQASVTNSVETNNRLYKEFGDFMQKQKNKVIGAVCLGAHLEGPFIAQAKKGAHEEQFLLAPNIELTQKWNQLSQNNLRLVTYAGELQDGSYTSYLLKNKIIASIGHSDMEAKEFAKDWFLGVRHITHLFNGMSGVDQHRPGLVVAALNHQDVIVELITDGIHIKPEVLKMVYVHKGPEQIVIITDAINAKGLADGEYQIGQLPVVKKGIQVTLKATNNLAGSGATYDHNVRTFQKICDISMLDLIKMTSINAAKQLEIFDKTGTLAPNKLADIVVLNHYLQVTLTIAEGRMIYNAFKS